MKNFYKINIVTLLLLSSSVLFAQNPVANCTSGAIHTFTATTGCVGADNNNYTLSGGFANYDPAEGDVPSCIPAKANEDGWWKFTAIGASTTIDLTGDRSHLLAVYEDGTCGSLTEIACATAGAGATASVTFGTTNGTTYIIRVVSKYGKKDGKNLDMVGKICIYGPASGPPANDDCGGATPLSVNPDLSCGNVTNSTLFNATGSAQANGCLGNADDDVWFSFVATYTSHYIDLLNIAGSDPSITHSVFAAAPGCGSLGAEVFCAAPFSYSSIVPGLVIGQTYYVRVWTTAATPSPISTVFDICIGTNAPPPASGGCGSPTYYDTGGMGANYSNSENYIETYCSDGGAGTCLEFDFTAFDLESGFDKMTIYDGPDANAPVAGIYSGTELNGQSIQSSTGCLTVKFVSDGSVTRAGWAANISCSPCPTCNDGIRNGSEQAVDCGGSQCAPCPCSDVTIPSLPYAVAGEATVGLNRYGSGDACGSSYMNGDEKVYSYTPSVDQSIDILLSNATDGTSGFSTSYAGLFLLDGCPDDGTTSCLAFKSGSNASITCQPVTAGETYFIVVSSWPTPDDIEYDLLVKAGTTSSPTCGLNYSHSTIPYAPEDYNTGTSLTFTDDRMSPVYSAIGFPFCYDGVIYNDALVSSNGYILFPGCYAGHPYGTEKNPDDYSPYSINAPAPNTTNAPTNAIMGPWQDIYPSNTDPLQGEIRTKTVGTAPNRKFVNSYKDVRMFSCTTDDFNGQIILEETTNNIEIHLGEKTVCATFNGGAAIMGLTDYTGTQAVIPGGYNYPTQWTASNEGHLFTNNCATCTVILPFELIEFTGVSKETSNVLKWEVTSNEEIDYFVVERSNGGSMFYELSKLDNLAKEFTHFNPNEKEFYRLRQVTKSGKVAYSSIIDIESIKNHEIKLYPNKISVGEIVNIEFKTKGDFVKLEIIDLAGKIIEVETIDVDRSGTIKFNTEKLSQGSYIYKVSVKEGDKVGKIVVN